MNLSEEQRQRVSAWILEGAKLSEIQNRLLSEFKLKLTYMEVRFLVDDLKLTPKDPEPPKVVAPPAAAPAKLTAEKSCTRRNTSGFQRQCFRGSNRKTRRDCQRQGHVQRRTNRRLDSRPDRPARRRARTARLQTVRRRRAAISNRVAAGSRQARILK